MHPIDLIDICLSLEDKIKHVIELGVRYEVWLQIELGLKLIEYGYNIELEKKPPKSKTKSIDLLIHDNNDNYFIEIKTESPMYPGKFASQLLYKAGGNDIFKLQNECMGPKDIKDENLWVLIICHSKESLKILEELSIDTPPSHFKKGSTIGVAVYYAYFY